MRKKIFHNWGLKLGSLVLAFVLWLLMIQIGDPKETRTFRGIQVNLTNTELLDQQNKVYEVLDNTNRASVTVRAPRSVFDNLSAADIVAEADMSKLTEINTIVISYDVLNADVDTVRGNPEVLRLKVEDRRSKPIDIRYSIIGEVAEGYMVSSARPDVTRIEVTGPESDVVKISYASVELDVSGATKDITASVEVVLYDVEGNVLDLPSVTKTTDYVKMTVEVLATRQVPINLKIMGNPARGYLATGAVDSSHTTVQIAGRASALANITDINIPMEALDITGATGNVTFDIDIRDYLPSNISLADSSFNGKVTVTVYIEPEMERIFELTNSAFTLTNVPQGYEALLPEPEEPYELRVSGLEEVISALQENEIAGIIDLAAWMEEQNLEELTPGVHRIPVTFSLPEEVLIKNPVVLPVTIVELED